jgi:hypothetical protein
MNLELRSLNGISDEEWDEMLLAMPDWRIYQTSAWLRFLEETQGVQPLHLGVFDGDRQVGCWAAAAFSMGPLRLIGSPMRGWTTPYMGPACDNLPAYELLMAWRRYLKKNRIHPAQVDHPRFYLEAGQAAGLTPLEEGTFMCPLPSTEEEILAQFHDSCRKAARRAQRRGVVVENTDNPAFIDHFYYQLEDVFGKQGIRPTYPKSRIQALWNHLKPTGRLLTLWALWEGQVIGTGIYLIGNQWLLSFASSSLRQTQKHFPNEIIRLMSMTMGSAGGCVAYDLSGRGDYKAKFGAHLETYYDWLYYSGRWGHYVRNAYALFRKLRLRRGIRKEVMPPRPPLSVDHVFQQ